MGSRAGHGAKCPLPLHEAVGHKQKSSALPSRKSFILGIATVAVLLALRYLAEVKAQVTWQTSGAQPQHSSSDKHRNTCYKARDGICDEGRPHRTPAKQQYHLQQQAAQGMPDGVSAVHCDLGTDCRDCGPWSGRQAHETWSHTQLPVAFLKSHNVSVRSQATSASAGPVNLSFAFTDPALDWDVSNYIQREGVLEVGISQVFYTLLAGRCSSGGPGGLVVDVGANFGWYSLLAAKLGCRVIAWEPVPQFLAIFSHNLARNNLTHQVQVRPTVVANPPGSKQVVVIPSHGIWGTAGIAGLNVDSKVGGRVVQLQQVEVVAEGLDNVLAGQHVDLLKIDVEGYEPDVLATAAGLLAAESIDNIILEYSPGVYERANRWSELWVYPRMLLNLSGAGFKLMHLTDEFTRVWSDDRAITKALPRFRQILPENLMYDLWDVDTFDTGFLNPNKSKPFCQAMIELQWGNLGVPERLHPKSFHSVFSHNTNVWASRDAKAYSDLLDQPVGVFPLDVPITSSWFPPASTQLGLGGIPCTDLAQDTLREMYGSQGTNNNNGSKMNESAKLPESEINTKMTVLICRRCRCTHNLPCKQHEAAAEGCAKAGHTPYVDLNLEL